jgi:uncharacterized protein (TIGR02266 family)
MAPAPQHHSAPATPEQRKTPRYEVSALVDCTGTEVYLRHRVINISLGGVCIQVDAAEEIGTEVELLIHFPDLNASLPARGQVVWANRSHPVDMGIRFVNLDDKKQDTLKQYLAKVQHAA